MTPPKACQHEKEKRLIQLGKYATYQYPEDPCPGTLITEDTRQIIEMFYICHNLSYSSGVLNIECILSASERLDMSYNVWVAWGVVRSELHAIHSEEVEKANKRARDKANAGSRRNSPLNKSRG